MRPVLEPVGRFDPERARGMLLNTFDPQQSWKILLEGELVGFFTLREEVDHWHLHHFYIHPDWQNRGLGGLALSQVFRRAKGKPLRLRAFRSSDANRFYVRHGFVLMSGEEWDCHYERPLSR